MELCDELRPFISVGADCPNYRACSVEKKVALTLYYLRDTGRMRLTANTFGFSPCTVSKYVRIITHTISSKLANKYIRMPETTLEMKNLVSRFEVKFGMPQASGCIDGTHIKIKAPSVDSSSYYNYKNYHSLNVQAICDEKGVFMDVDCRWPGAAHDAKVFASSAINQRMKNKDIPEIFNYLVPGEEKVPNYLIGDPAYPLLPNVMKEYAKCENNAQVVFNNMLRSARNPIECAFGRLKAKWAILSSTILLDLEYVPELIMACFVLHNFIALKNDDPEEEAVRKQIEANQADEKLHANVADPIFSKTTSEGQYIRKIITKYMED